MANHFRLDLNLIEGLTIVNPNNAPNHFRHYNHVPKVGSHRLWLLTRWCLPFLLYITSKPKLNVSLHSQSNTHYNHKSSNPHATKNILFQKHIPL